jgi:hypothetical protein
MTAAREGNGCGYRLQTEPCMTSLSARSIIYEINTWVWLAELSRQRGEGITLANVPDEAWDDLERLGIDAVWLMGVWERSPAGKALTEGNDGLLADFRLVLSNFVPEDNVGSPYCIRRYAVDPHLGGPEGLAVAREALAGRQIRLILDFVPNHVAPDHPWVADHPEYFIPGNADDLHQAPGSFMNVGKRIFARGRDPFFPAWPDVLQLNAFHPGLRRAIIDTMNDVADQCDGVRCDMAMLVLNDIFGKTWGGRLGVRPETEYWPKMIQAVRKDHPQFLFIAEAYWDTEWELQQQGFDFCYDKRLYDRLENGDAEMIGLHLRAESAYQERLVRFIENHDERRAAVAFQDGKGRAAALTMATIPGALLFHEGQFTGRKIRLPVFLGRRPDEPIDDDLRDFYDRLLEIVRAPGLRNGSWRLCEWSGWPDNGSYRNLMAWYWTFDEDCTLIVVNFAGADSQGCVWIPGFDWAGKSWRMTDIFTGVVYDRNGDDLTRLGLYVDLPPWGYHVFHCQGGGSLSGPIP